jgi:hypothetical protein
VRVSHLGGVTRINQQINYKGSRTPGHAVNKYADLFLNVDHVLVGNRIPINLFFFGESY